jgi:protein TonB
MSSAAYHMSHFAAPSRPHAPKAEPSSNADLRGTRFVPRHYDEVVGETRRGLRRSVAITLAVLLHVALLYLVVTGTGRAIIARAAAPIIATIIEAPPPAPPPPMERLAPRMAEMTRPVLPLPDIQIAAPPSPNAITQVSFAQTIPPGQLAPMQQPQPAAQHGTLRQAHAVSPQDCVPLYPPSSLRNGETGVAKMQLLISAKGEVIEAKLDGSTGFRRLDDAALIAAKACKFVPANTDGKAEQAWHAFSYNFNVRTE